MQVMILSIFLLSIGFVEKPEDDVERLEDEEEVEDPLLQDQSH